ncbi:MAG: MFS transporter, partial [Waddliaceae bacterium]|nr:MFS transporter [Waddliaceae bacterium]
MNYFLKLLKPAPHKTEIADEDVLNKTFRYWRIRILYTMFFGYAVFYFTRMTFTFAMPELKPLGFDEVGLGWILTIGQISYGMSRFFSGILADRSNPRYLMAIGLMITGVINILFGLSTSLVLFMVFWGINGWFQGWGSAPCHRLITHWYSPNERGRWWGVWNTAHNIGAALIPFLAVFLISRSGWRLSMYVPGIIAIVVSLFIINRLRDTPQSLGLPPVEKWRNDTSAPPIRGVERELSTKEILFQYVLTNRYIWLLAVSYFMVYIVRWAVISWSYLFLVNSQGYSHWLAAFCFFGFEFGGFFGGMLAGWLSDVVFKGRRGPVNAIFMIAIVPAVLFFWYVSSY